MATAGHPLVSIVVVNFNAGAHLSACVASVLAQQLDSDSDPAAPEDRHADPESSRDCRLEVLVVDNASSDSSLAALPQHKSLQVLKNTSNLGYSRACNQGVAAARAPWICLLNPDSQLPDGALQALLSAAQQPNLQAPLLIGVRVVDAQGIDQRATWRRLPTPWRALTTFTGLERIGLGGVNEAADLNAAGSNLKPAVQPTLLAREAVSGACLFMARSEWQALGGMDEGFFLHCEDLDLFKRIHAAGGEVRMLAQLKVLHWQGISSRRRPLRVTWHKHRGMARYVLKHAPGGRWNPFNWLVLTGIWLRFTLLTPLLLFGGAAQKKSAQAATAGTTKAASSVNDPADQDKQAR